jgi:hypothetical protein
MRVVMQDKTACAEGLQGVCELHRLLLLLLVVVVVLLLLQLRLVLLLCRLDAARLSDLAIGWSAGAACCPFHHHTHTPPDPAASPAWLQVAWPLGTLIGARTAGPAVQSCRAGWGTGRSNRDGSALLSILL